VAKSFGSTSNDYGRCIITDGGNNLICAGTFNGTVDFDLNAGTFPMTSSGAGDIFLMQISSAGNFTWAKSMGGTGIDQVAGLTRDIYGNVYITGSFNGTADLDPGSAAVYNVTSNGATDVFINWLQAFIGRILDKDCRRNCR
jgi:hypothetical protein